VSASKFTDQAIVVVDPSSGVRPVMSAGLRKIGFTNVVASASILEILPLLKTQKVDWIITSALIKSKANVLQLLKLIIAVTQLRELKISVFVEPDESFILLKAFSLGLFSWHQRPFNGESFDAVVALIKKQMVQYSGDTTLVAAEYLRPLLADRSADLLAFNHKMSAAYPERADLLLPLAECQFRNAEHSKARALLWKAIQMDESLDASVNKISERYSDREAFSGSEDGKLDIKSCVVIDNDSAVQNGILGLLQNCGVEQIDVFSDGLSYWTWQQDNVCPDLIVMEWKIPKLSAPLLIQRLKASGFGGAPIIVHSSLVQKSDESLLKEMGVMEVVKKPFRRDHLLNCLIGTLRQNSRPTEVEALERKIFGLLEAGKLPEATGFMQIYVKNHANQDGKRKHLEAEFAFATKNYKEARELANTAIKLGNKNVSLLNLLGKVLLKLRDFSTALEIFNIANNIAPDSIARLCTIAETHEEMGDTGKALAVLEKTTTLDAENQKVINTKVNIGLSSGNAEMVKESFDKFRPSENILSFINNRAVGLIKAGEIDQGIKLYGNVLSTLPAKGNRSREVVAYNLALAYARKNDLSSLLATLTDDTVFTDSVLKAKATSLVKRAKVAQDNNKTLNLSTESTAEIVVKESVSSKLINEFVKVDGKKPDFCCHSVFLWEEKNDLVEALTAEPLKIFTKKKNRFCRQLQLRASGRFFCCVLKGPLRAPREIPVTIPSSPPLLCAT